MKGTLKEITGQESGFLMYSDNSGYYKIIFYDWSGNKTKYNCDKRKTRKIDSCYKFLSRYCDRDSKNGNLEYIVKASYDMDLDDFYTWGKLYYLDGLEVLAPYGWE